MRAGAQSIEVVIEREVRTGLDKYNKPTITWDTWLECWAAIEARKGTEHFEGGRRYHQDVFRLTFRYEDVEGLNAAGFRMRFGGQTYRPINVLPDHARRERTMVDVVLFGGSQTESV